MRTHPAGKLAYSVRAAVEATGGGLSRSRLFLFIKDGTIASRKIGRRRIRIKREGPALRGGHSATGRCL